MLECEKTPQTGKYVTIRSHLELASGKAGDLATRSNIRAVAYAGLKYFLMSHGSSTCMTLNNKACQE